MAGESTSSAELERRVATVRQFNRFYTSRIGVLHYLGGDFSLAEVRVLYELAHRPAPPTASELGRELRLDAGYLSRLLRGFERRGLIARTRSDSDGRRSHVALTAAGRAAFAPLGARSHQEMVALLAPLSDADQERVVEAMRLIETVLGGAAAAPPFSLRLHRPGDIGWVVQRHGALYAEEYGWDEHFEALVAAIAARFIERYDPARERCWIAEKDGERVGSVFLVKRSKTVAQLRLLLVEPRARGLGIGARLVAECERFARDAGYRKIVLWTNSVLTSARRIYEGGGYRLIDSERHRSFGHDLVGETWEKTL
ncbi:MAG TPA: bifunctional helix-turn-helix transcriptional regulator/GNAT family N-acetyltransferase [Methylomirabilota bacterium]|jgi:DNA-binding MarR family transcriptional regulator/N-acetylglutamate synthase-like GNAT family acetyltransferase|nr:bifunctional helix-turn-helix transcriptional regulator/GNAT family N-acetyltransferase [Methylomirabilota bacterium]